MTSFENQTQPALEDGEKTALLEDIARTIRDRRMQAPAILCLESLNPISTVLHSAALVSQPLLSLIFGTERGRKLLSLLESRQDIERLIQLIENPAVGKEH